MVRPPGASDVTQVMLDRLVAALKHPSTMMNLSLEQWDWLIRVGRRADMLARLAHAASEGLAGGLAVLPEQVQMHLRSAMILADRQCTELGYESQAIVMALKPAGIRPVLLKGAAYVLAGQLAGRGRLVSDVDILVPRGQLNEVEAALMMAGWVSTDRDAYNQAYYRRWMHELPPMTHMRRGTTVDVHHALVPPTAGYGVPLQSLLDAACPDARGFSVLCDTDQVIHSAVHLMHEGELEMGFRGLVDIDALVTEFAAADTRFWPRLAARAVDLHLQRPVFLALRYSNRLLGTPVPVDCLATLHAAARPLGVMRLSILDALYERGLRPDHASLDDRFSGLARWLLYMRSHFLRMPLHLLLPHLARKSFVRMTEAYKNGRMPDAKA